MHPSSGATASPQPPLLLTQCYPKDVQPPARRLLSLIPVFSCLYRIGVPIGHTTYLYIIHPSKYNFLAFQLVSIGAGVTISAIAVALFWTSVRKHVHSDKQLRAYQSWVVRNQFEKAVRWVACM